MNVNPESRYWQHRRPLHCPKGHVMGWLGITWWLCSKCSTIYGTEDMREPEDVRRYVGTAAE